LFDHPGYNPNDKHIAMSYNATQGVSSSAVDQLGILLHCLKRRDWPLISNYNGWNTAWTNTLS